MGSVPLLLHAAATASFVGCVFADNAGVVGGQRDGLAVLDGAVGGAMRMEACSFMGNTVDFAAVDASDLSSGRIFSDSTEVSARRRHVPIRPLSAPVPTGLPINVRGSALDTRLPIHSR